MKVSYPLNTINKRGNVATMETPHLVTSNPIGGEEGAIQEFEMLIPALESAPRMIPWRACESLWVPSSGTVARY